MRWPPASEYPKQGRTRTPAPAARTGAFSSRRRSSSISRSSSCCRSPMAGCRTIPWWRSKRCAATANVALSAYLLMSAIGVLLGGYVVSRTERHDGTAIAGLAANAVTVLALAVFDVAAPVLILLMAAAGLFQGLIMPSRDMLVRAVTPRGAFGTVFGFVTTGFNIAGIVAPLVFGWMMDQGNPQAIFIASAAFGLASILTVMVGTARR